MAGELIINVVGNLVADPELRYTQSGVAVCSFRVAQTKRAFNKQSGQWEDGGTVFVRCSAWRDMGENVAESLSKGARVMVTGEFMQQEYTDGEGVKRTSYEVNVLEVGPSLRTATAVVTRAVRPEQADAPARSAAPAKQPAPTKKPAPARRTAPARAAARVGASADDPFAD